MALEEGDARLLGPHLHFPYLALYNNFCTCTVEIYRYWCAILVASFPGSPCLEGRGREPGNEATFLVHMDTITFFNEKVKSIYNGKFSHLVNFPLRQSPLCQFPLCQHWPNVNWQSGILMKWEVDWMGIDEVGNELTKWELNWRSGNNLCHMLFGGTSGLYV